MSGDLERLDEAIAQAGPTAEEGVEAPEGAMLVAWVIVAEWAVPGEDGRQRRWVDTRTAPGQSVSTSVGLARLGERYMGG